MRIPIDHQNKTPLYRQIETYLQEGILSGSLAPDTRLPSSRQLAQELGVSRITVENAYAELEASGLVLSQTGSGTYVLPPSIIQSAPKNIDAWPLWQQDITLECTFPKYAYIQDILKSCDNSDLINFTEGIGDPRLFPVEDFRKMIQTVLRRDGVDALGYGDRKGYAPLRNTISNILGSQGIHTHPDNVLITAGSHQAISLVARLLLKPGDTIIAENPTYSVALSLFQALNLRIVGIPTDNNGMQVEKLEELLKKYHPKLIYTMPNFQNPTGTCLSNERRRKLIALGDSYNVPILEDDFVGDLRYDGVAQPALKSLDPGGRVIYVNSFSKVLIPGFRVGFLVAEGPVYDMLVKYKYLNELQTSSLIQRALDAYVTVGRYQSQLRRSRQVYRKRRDAMLAAVKRHLPGDVHIDSPQGGLFMWLRLNGILTEKLLPIALQEGVYFPPNGIFFCDDNYDDNFISLTFVSHTPDVIEEGIARLGNAIKRYRDEER